MPDYSEMIKLFQTKAEQVSARVQEFATVQDAIACAIDVCSHKKVCAQLQSGCEAEVSEGAQALCDVKFGKHIVAAPDLYSKDRICLIEHCLKKGIKTVFKDLRQHLGGVDMAITWAQYGIAETGTVVINSTNEDLRLATMISEVHMVLLEEKNIRNSADDLTVELKKMMQDADNYTAFITGASRTADIERVLAMGVHGPLELYILLIKEEK
ncbi:MAG: lactate utilization protein [Pseudomonadota bacterium]